MDVDVFPKLLALVTLLEAIAIGNQQFALTDDEATAMMPRPTVSCCAAEK